MSDYRVRISVRNARLLRAIERAGHRPGAPYSISPPPPSCDAAPTGKSRC